MAEFFRLEASQFRKPLLINKLNKASMFHAYVDVDEKFSVTDKLSMINTLLQMENVTSYQMIRNAGKINIHAFWFDIYTGEIHIFSRKKKTFVIVNDETMAHLEVNLTNTQSSYPKCPPQAELYELSSRSGIQENTQKTDVPLLRSLVSEARRNFSTSPCAQGSCHHSHGHQALVN